MPTFMYIGGKAYGSQTYTSGSGNFTVPPYTENLRVRLWGGGGPGSTLSPGGTAYVGTAGTASTWNTSGHPVAGTISAGGGAYANGGAATGGTINTSGSNSPTSGVNFGYGGDAANTAQGGGTGAAMAAKAGSGVSGLTGNAYGGGGSSAQSLSAGNWYAGRGGGGGAFAEKIYAIGDLNPGATIAYSVGSGGVPYTTSGYNIGGYGANGGIFIEWDY